MDDFTDEYPEFSCPDCGETGTIWDFDVGGADPGHVFCNQCNEHFVPE